jgi:hypothetical protein
MSPARYAVWTFWHLMVHSAYTINESGIKADEIMVLFDQAKKMPIGVSINQTGPGTNLHVTAFH